MLATQVQQNEFKNEIWWICLLISNTSNYVNMFEIKKKTWLNDNDSGKLCLFLHEVDRENVPTNNNILRQNPIEGLLHGSKEYQSMNHNHNVTWSKSAQGWDVKYLKCCTFISINHEVKLHSLYMYNVQGHYFLTNSPNNCFESTRTVTANLPSVLAIVKRDWLDCSAWL